jgi:DNA-binding XRE family transcriptional regulator
MDYRKSRGRHLTAEEIESDKRIRDLIEKEKPEINARIGQRMAAIRRAKAAHHGARTLGDRIRMAREARGLSQVSLASDAKISQGYLSQLEQDEREPTLSIAARIARALELSLDDLAAGVSS